MTTNNNSTSISTNAYTICDFTNVAATNISSYQDNTVALAEAIAQLQNQMDSMIDFLKLKGIIINNDEFSEFMVSRALMKKMEKD